MTNVDANVTVDGMIEWLSETIAQYADIPTAQIDPSAQLSDHGLDSVAAMALIGEVEDAFGVVPDITALWDHPTVRELAAYLVDFVHAEKAAV